MNNACKIAYNKSISLVQELHNTKVRITQTKIPPKLNVKQIVSSLSVYSFTSNTYKNLQIPIRIIIIIITIILPLLIPWWRPNTWLTLWSECCILLWCCSDASFSLKVKKASRSSILCTYSLRLIHNVNQQSRMIEICINTFECWKLSGWKLKIVGWREFNERVSQLIYHNFKVIKMVLVCFWKIETWHRLIRRRCLLLIFVCF